MSTRRPMRLSPDGISKEDEERLDTVINDVNRIGHPTVTLLHLACETDLYVSEPGPAVAVGTHSNKVFVSIAHNEGSTIDLDLDPEAAMELAHQILKAASRVSDSIPAPTVPIQTLWEVACPDDVLRHWPSYRNPYDAACDARTFSERKCQIHAVSGPLVLAGPCPGGHHQIRVRRVGLASDSPPEESS